MDHVWKAAVLAPRGPSYHPDRVPTVVGWFVEFECRSIRYWFRFTGEAQPTRDELETIARIAGIPPDLVGGSLVDHEPSVEVYLFNPQPIFESDPAVDLPMTLERLLAPAWRRSRAAHAYVPHLAV